ncbi:hypothetical protein DJ62_3258 [Yersinia enterocolitica]|nr:hypothetical protein DJ62_3258 [Yersinia enterocolitica]
MSGKGFFSILTNLRKGVTRKEAAVNIGKIAVESFYSAEDENRVDHG